MDQEIVLKVIRNFVLVAIATSMLAACGGGGSSLAPAPHQTSNPVMTGNGVLATRQLNGAAGFVNQAGFTVYVFDLDLTSPGHSLCNTGNGCSQNWPPLAPPNGAKLTGGFGTIQRSDGTTQLTYNGRPLYNFAFDKQPGQANGDGLNEFGGVWHIARPQAASNDPQPTPMATRTGY